MGYIYKITNIINNKIYIGQTKKTIEERFKVHIRHANNHVNRYLYDAMNYYGVGNFIIEQIEECDNGKLDNRERFWISYYQSNNKEYGYNMTEGGGGGDTWTNNPHKQETINKSKETKIRNGTLHNGGCHSSRKGYYFIDIPKDELLRCLYDKNMSIQMICEKFNCSPYTIRERCKDYFGKKLSEMNVTNIIDINEKIDIRQFMDCVNNLVPRKEAAIELDVTVDQLDKYCLLLYGETYMKFLPVHRHNRYKSVDIEKMKDLLDNPELTKKEICKILDLAPQTLEIKCKDYFGKTVNEYRNIKANKHKKHIRKIISDKFINKSYVERYGKEQAEEIKKNNSERWKGNKNPNYVEVDRDALLSLIVSNTKIEDIAKHFSTSKQTIYAKCLLYFDTRKTREVKKLWNENLLT